MHLKDFETFLKGIDLSIYREEYRPIKIVEMDLPRNIQAIALLYKVYWDEKRFINYHDFYQEYLNVYRKDIEDFRKKIMMCRKCFYKGLPARIYRTWASIVTQIHAGYVAEYVFGEGAVNMSEELDHRGADIQVKYKGCILNYQVKKESMSREVRASKKVKTKITGKFVDIYYHVPSEDYFKNPKRKDGTYKIPYLRFEKDETLERFDNGFVVFTSKVFMETKKKIDSEIKLD